MYTYNVMIVTHTYICAHKPYGGWAQRQRFPSSNWRPSVLPATRSVGPCHSCGDYGHLPRACLRLNSRILNLVVVRVLCGLVFCLIVCVVMRLLMMHLIQTLVTSSVPVPGSQNNPSIGVKGSLKATIH